jgi:predicted ATPase
VGKSLVSTEIDASGLAIYRLFEMTRAYALEKLAQNNEADAVARQHAAHFSRLFASVTAKELASARTVKRRDTNFTSPKCALHWNGCSRRRMPRVSAWSSPPVSSPCP